MSPINDPHDYASAELLQNTMTYEWIHPIGEIVTSLLVSCRTFSQMVARA
jgi:hypothetical protein